MHKLGCIGEVAVAIYLGLERFLFQQKNAIANSVDLPGNIEVKTRSKHGYDLLIQLDDEPSKLFVLVTCDGSADSRKARIIGWTYGANVMKREFVREFVRGRPCYAIRQSLLNSIETLMDEIKKPCAPDRTLRPDEAWLVRQDEETLLAFSEVLLEELGWKPGDTLTWRIDAKASSYYLSKTK